jgi:hypothetical protein
MSREFQLKRRWRAFSRNPVVRNVLFAIGLVLVLLAPVVGILPGPGGIIFFGVGFGLMLKYSEWVKRRYVRFKRAHPNKGRWADWGLRRGSARRREALRTQEEGEAERPAIRGAGD